MDRVAKFATDDYAIAVAANRVLDIEEGPIHPGDKAGRAERGRRVEEIVCANADKIGGAKPGAPAPV